MPNETYTDGRGRVTSHHIGPDKTDMSASDLDRRMKATNLGALGKKGKGPFPKQADFATTPQWQAAIKKWHDTPDAEVDGAKRALSRLGGK